MTAADTETLFLVKNQGEFCITVEKEKSIIDNVLKNSDCTWFIAEYDGKLVGQCFVGWVRGYQRYRHRVEVAFVFSGAETIVSVSGREYVTSDRLISINDIITIDLSLRNNKIGGDYALQKNEPDR